MASAVLGPFIRMLAEGDVVPVASVLQLLKTYWVPVVPATVSGVTVACASVEEGDGDGPPAATAQDVTFFATLARQWGLTWRVSPRGEKLAVRREKGDDWHVVWPRSVGIDSSGPDGTLPPLEGEGVQ